MTALCCCGERIFLGNGCAGAVKRRYCQSLVQSGWDLFLGPQGLRWPHRAAESGGWLCEPLIWTESFKVASQHFPPLLVPCCVHLGVAAGSLVTWAQPGGGGRGRKKSGGWGRTGWLWQGGVMLRRGRSPEIPTALWKPNGSLVLQQRPACRGSSGWVGKWCSGPGKGRAHRCPPGVNGDRCGLAKGGKGQALSGQTNPCPAPLLRGDPSLPHCFLCLSKDWCILSDTLY